MQLQVFRKGGCTYIQHYLLYSFFLKPFIGKVIFIFVSLVNNNLGEIIFKAGKV